MILPKLAVLLSGQGSNLQAIIDAIQRKHIEANIALVLSDQASAYGLQRARKAGISTEVLTSSLYLNREAYDDALKTVLEQYQPDWIILAGFMRVLSPKFVEHFQGRLINIHPSLLPRHKGLHTHQRVLEAGDKQHGVTVHYVTPELDSGPIIAQSMLDVAPTDTVASLKAKIHELEHKLYPKVIAALVKSCKNNDCPS